MNRLAPQLFLILALSIPLASSVVCAAGKCFCANGYGGCACGDIECCKRSMGIVSPGPVHSSPGSVHSSPGIDHEAERQRLEAEAVEQARQAETRRQQQEAERQAEFIRQRNEAASTLKGSAGSSTSELKGVSSTDSYGLKGAESRIGRDLKSIEGDSSDAASRNKEASGDKARGGFDRRSSSDRGTLVIPKISGNKPTPPSSLAAQIDPKALKDPEVQKSLAWYEHLEKVKAETKQKIAETQQQQKNGTGDKAALSAHLGTLTNQIKDLDSQQAKAKEEVKKTVVNRGFVWNEVEAPAAVDKSGVKK